VLADGLWPTFADPNQLENALLNLALNARDAMPGGGKLVIETANVRLSKARVAALNEAVDPGDYVMISVADTGTGMDRATRERAFDPFFTTKAVGKGTGLGLSQVYGFARQSAGHVRIDSEIGKGATVRIYLPRSERISKPDAETSTVGVARASAAQTILLVEDDEAVRAYAEQSLRELGYGVLEATNGVAALTTIESDERIDLLLTDIVMPGGIDGRRLAESAARLRPGLGVLFMTGYAPDAVVHQGPLDAREHLIAKPFSFAGLAAKVREALNDSPTT